MLRKAENRECDGENFGVRQIVERGTDLCVPNVAEHEQVGPKEEKQEEPPTGFGEAIKINAEGKKGRAF